MVLSSIADLLPRPHATGIDVPFRAVGRGGCSFSDDLGLFGGDRLGVRVRITDAEPRWLVDFRDCATPRGTPTFGLTEAHARTATAIAFGHALDLDGPVAESRVELLTDAETWIGGAAAPDPAAIAFGMARVFDAVVGALANAWPGTVGAGSCSLGAIVGLGPTPSLVEVVAGGGGATPRQPGTDRWPGPILPTTSIDDPPRWLTIRRATRTDSGGVGARRGGAGVVVQLQVREPVPAFVAIDRIDNPPHGVDRAGPGLGARLRVELLGGGALAVRPWTRFELPAHATLVVETCGGAGHGFPGYGDIEWDG